MGVTAKGHGSAGRLSGVTVVETLLVFVGAPLAVFLLLAALVYLPAGRKRARYRPGQPWEHEPVWYEPHPENASAESHGEAKAIGSSVYPERPAIGFDSHATVGSSAHGPTAIGGASADGASAGGASAHGASAVGASTGGASAAGAVHGASAVGASTGGASAVGAPGAPAPAKVGPLGGARGTW